METQRANPMFITPFGDPCPLLFRVQSWLPNRGFTVPEDAMNLLPLLAGLAVKAFLEWLMSAD